MGSGKGGIYIFFALRVHISLHFSTECTEREGKTDLMRKLRGFGWRRELSWTLHTWQSQRVSRMPGWALLTPACREQLKQASLLEPRLPEPRQPSEAPCLLSSTDSPFCQEKQWRQRRNTRRAKWHPASVGPRGWRILEFFTFLTPLR